MPTVTLRARQGSNRARDFEWHRSLRCLGIALAGLLVVGVGAQTASAATTRVGDNFGDASPAFDIRSVSYINADSAVVFRVKVQRLRSFTVIGGYLAEIGDYDGYEFRAWNKDGQLRTWLNYTYGASGAERVACADVSVQWRTTRNYVRVSFPRSCISEVNGRLRMAASTSDARANKWSSVDYAAEVRLRQG